MNKRMLTIEEVSEVVRHTPRSVRNLPIPFARIGRKRLYDPKSDWASIEGAWDLQALKNLRVAIDRMIAEREAVAKTQQPPQTERQKVPTVSPSSEPDPST